MGQNKIPCLAARPQKSSVSLLQLENAVLVANALFQSCSIYRSAMERSMQLSWAAYEALC